MMSFEIKPETEGHCWYNFKKQEYEYVFGFPENMKDYIPQDRASKGIFECHKQLGKSDLGAAMEVLNAHARIIEGEHK